MDSAESNLTYIPFTDVNSITAWKWKFQNNNINLGYNLYKQKFESALICQMMMIIY